MNKYIVCHFDIRFVPQVCSEWHSQEDTIISTFALDCCLLQYSYKDTAHKKKKQETYGHFSNFPQMTSISYVGLCIYNQDLGLILVLTEFCLQIILTKCQYYPESDVPLSLAAGDSDHAGGDCQELHGGHLLLLRPPGDTWSPDHLITWL